MKTFSKVLLALCFTGLCLVFLPPLLSQQSHALVEGKLLYTKGIRSNDVKVNATISGTTINAKILPCVNCHGDDGKGIAEGGVIPSRVDWPTLSKSYNVTLANGRNRGPYNEQSLLHLLRTRIDPNGNEIDAVMPVYDLTIEDVHNLKAYLEIIGNEHIPGITESKVKIGIVLQKKDKVVGRSEAIVSTMKAYSDLINTGGGIFNRSIEIVECYLDEYGNISEELIDQYIETKQIFSFVANDMEAISPESVKLISNSKIPVIGAISGNPTNNDYLDRDFYYLLPGIYNEIEQLLNLANEQKQPNEAVGILFDPSADSSIDFAYLEKNFSEFDLYETTDFSNYNILIDSLTASNINHIVYVGSGADGLELISKTNDSRWFPSFYTSGKNASKEWFTMHPEMQHKVFLSYPTWPTARKNYAMQQYNEMCQIYALDKNFKYAQLHALSSLIVFSETLRRVGKNFTTDSFLAQLKQLKDFETGYVSTISYGANKRIGSEKVFVAKMDLVKKDIQLVK